MPANAATAGPTLSLAPALNLRRVYILPTRHGYSLGGLLLIILLGAINYDNALAYLLCFLLGGLVLVAMLHTYRNLAGLRLAAVSAAPVFAGEPADFALRIVSLVARPRCNVRIAWPASGRRGAGHATWLAGIAMEAETVLRIPTTQRGLLPLNRLRIESVFPLGILRAWAYFETTASGLVYPAPRGRLPLPFIPGKAAATAAGSVLGTDDFAGLNPYRAGDTWAAIHWPSLAKSETLLVKRFHGGGEGEIRLQWQALAGMPDDEARLAQLARWVLEAEAAGLRYGLELPQVSLPQARGVTHRAAVLRALALYHRSA